MSNTRHSTLFLYLQYLHYWHESISFRFYYSAILQKYRGLWLWFTTQALLSETYLQVSFWTRNIPLLYNFGRLHQLPSRNLYLWVIFVAKHNFNSSLLSYIQLIGQGDWLFCCGSPAYHDVCAVFKHILVLAVFLGGMQYSILFCIRKVSEVAFSTRINSQIGIVSRASVASDLLYYITKQFVWIGLVHWLEKVLPILHILSSAFPRSFSSKCLLAFYLYSSRFAWCLLAYAAQQPLKSKGVQCKLYHYFCDFYWVLKVELVNKTNLLFQNLTEGMDPQGEDRGCSPWIWWMVGLDGLKELFQPDDSAIPGFCICFVRGFFVFFFFLGHDCF